MMSLDARLRLALRARAERRRRRLIRLLYAEIDARYRKVTPVLFQLGLEVRTLPIEDPATVTEMLRTCAVFALDSAAYLRWGVRFGSTEDVFAYVDDADAVPRMEACADRGARLHVSVVDELPPHETLPSGHRVVTVERLAAELIGQVGPRLDLLAAFHAHAHPRVNGRTPP